MGRRATKTSIHIAPETSDVLELTRCKRWTRSQRIRHIAERYAAIIDSELSEIDLPPSDWRLLATISQGHSWSSRPHEQLVPLIMNNSVMAARMTPDLDQLIGALQQSYPAGRMAIVEMLERYHAGSDALPPDLRRAMAGQSMAA